MRTLDYDKLGRLQHDRVTTLGSGVDGTVRRITRSYEVRGLLQNLTSYDNATAGSGTVVNDVQYAYNGFIQLATEYLLRIFLASYFWPIWRRRPFAVLTGLASYFVAE